MKPKFRRVGWMGYSDNKPFYENVTDGYCELGQHVVAANIYKKKAEAKKRFQDVRPVFVAVKEPKNA